MFRTRPVVIEAIQYTGGFDGWNKAYDFLGAKLFPYFMNPETQDIHIETLEGRMCCHVGDWIIKGIENEFYPCKKEIFEKTYEIVCDNCLCEDNTHLMSCPRGYGREP